MGLFERLKDESEGRETAAALTLADVLLLPDRQRQIVNRMIREGPITLADAVAACGGDEAAARELLDALIEKGFVRERPGAEGSRFEARLAPKRGSSVPLNVWQSLESRIEGEQK